MSSMKVERDNSAAARRPEGRRDVALNRRARRRAAELRRQQGQQQPVLAASDDATAASSPHFPPASLPHRIIMMLAISVPFIGCLAAIVLLWLVGWMGWLYVAMLIGGWILTGLGVTVGFHRLLAHRSFETFRWLRGFWATMGALSIEGSPLIWCAVHRRHHAHSDEAGDPHSPNLHGDSLRGMLRGLWHAHLGWLFTSYWSKSDLKRLVPDLLNDKLLVGIDRMYFLCVIASLAIPAVLAGLITMSWMGALLGLIWGGLVRIFMTHHITWSINSVCHVFGRRQYRTSDHSTNNWLCGLLGLGEGWHNNHHAFPASARHGLHWWQFDLSWIVIRTMNVLGLAWNVHTPSSHALQSRRLS